MTFGFLSSLRYEKQEVNAGRLSRGVHLETPSELESERATPRVQERMESESHLAEENRANLPAPTLTLG